MRRVRVRDSRGAPHGQPLALTIVRVVVLDRAGLAYGKPQSLPRRSAMPLGGMRVSSAAPGVFASGRFAVVRSHRPNYMAVFRFSRSLRRVRAQNQDLRSQTVAPQLLTPERYVARTELAVIMGVSLATVDRMVAEGMPSVTWGRRTRRFRPSAAIAWALERKRAA